MKQTKHVCVFLGASFGNQKIYVDAIKQLGIEIANRQLTLVYGGGRLGLMGVLADTVLAQGGQVIGVMPTALYEKEVHLGLSTLYVVNSMQERKAMMAALSDGCLTFPGGLGTFEEMYECWSAAKIGLYDKPCGLLNIENYYDKMLDFINHVVKEGFLGEEHQQLMRVSTDAGELLDAMFGAAWPVKMAV